MGRRAMAVALGVATAIAVPSAALARGGAGVRSAGTCSAGVSSTLKAGAQDAGIEVEFELDQNRNGVAWRVVITRNGARVFSGSRTTHAPSGSFTLRRVITNAAGRDTIRVRATGPSGRVCRATVVV
ncbi:MAG: hypothetical protein U0Y82_02535 [Thermoleophilia bacterium]